MKSVSNTTELASVDKIHNLETPTKDRSHFLKSGIFAALLANVLWGTSFLASKYTLASWEPFTASALRFLLASILMFGGMKLFRRKINVPRSKQEWIGVFTVALTGFGLLYPLQLSGLKLVTSGMSAAIMLTSPLFVVVSGKIFLGENMTTRKVFAIGLGIVGGTILLSGKGGLELGLSKDFLMGSMLTMAASLSLAFSVIATRKLTKSLDSGSLTLWSMMTGFLMLALSAGAFENESLLSAFKTGTASSWTALLYLSLVCSAFCFFIWNFALSKASPREIASTMHIKTPTAVLLGVTLAGEHLTLPLVIGTVIVMTGVWISQTTPKRLP